MKAAIFYVLDDGSVMEKKSQYHCTDGRNYNITMAWNENFKDKDHIFKITFKAIDQTTDQPYVLPREIATYQIGDPDENLGERVHLLLRKQPRASDERLPHNRLPPRLRLYRARALTYLSGYTSKLRLWLPVRPIAMSV